MNSNDSMISMKEHIRKALGALNWKRPSIVRAKHELMVALKVMGDAGKAESCLSLQPSPAHTVREMTVEEVAVMLEVEWSKPFVEAMVNGASVADYKDIFPNLARALAKLGIIRVVDNEGGGEYVESY